MIVFLGDSITQAWPLASLGLAATPVNAGIGGETSADMRARYARDVAARRPACLHLLAGINDIAENRGPVTLDAVAANIGDMVERTLAGGTAMVLGTLTPATCVPWNPSVNPGPKVAALNARLRALAAAHPRVVLAEYFAALAAADGTLRPDCTTDGVHLNAAGYAALAPVARQALAQAGVEG